MRHLLIIALLLITLSAATRPPRCRVETSRGRAWLVCPCRTTYQCEDEWPIPRHPRA